MQVRDLLTVTLDGFPGQFSFRVLREEIGRGRLQAQVSQRQETVWCFTIDAPGSTREVRSRKRQPQRGGGLRMCAPTAHRRLV
jgi:hypothetical protein